MIARAIASRPRVLIFDEGKIAESGTYEELIAENGRFAALVDRQRLE